MFKKKIKTIHQNRKSTEIENVEEIIDLDYYIPQKEEGETSDYENEEIRMPVLTSESFLVPESPVKSSYLPESNDIEIGSLAEVNDLPVDNTVKSLTKHRNSKFCFECKKEFATKETFQNHTKFQHLKIYENICEFCHRAFTYKSYLNQHKLKCSQKKSQQKNYSKVYLV